VATSISEDSAALHHPPVRDFKWVCAGSMSGPERERERVCHGFVLKGPYFTVLDRQTHILSHYITEEGNKTYIYLYIYITLKKNKKQKNL
jgi:hypothetical protein